MTKYNLVTSSNEVTESIFVFNMFIVKLKLDLVFESVLKWHGYVFIEFTIFTVIHIIGKFKKWQVSLFSFNQKKSHVKS